jgi:hypothetical protein
MQRLLVAAVSVSLALALCACVSAGAFAAPIARIDARFAPEQLGAATTVSLGFQIGAGGHASAPLSSMQLAYPSNLSLATSDLGLAPCSPSALELLGVGACPPDSRMGSGSAIAQLQIGPSLLKENVRLALFAGPSADGYLHVVVYASGVLPIEAHVVLTGVLLPGHLSIAVPTIPSLPAAPDVAVTQMQLTLGGALTYYEQVGGRSIAYHPAGVGLPSRCPRGGFQFAATFAFLDGSHTSSRTAVPCPSRR